ncbi:MAG TPA: type II secretion system protein [Rhodocyclaceae bacterium]
MRMRRGFTLVELIVVIAVTGVLATSVTMFLLPAINNYFDTKRRANLTDMADTALRRMSQDIRRAVPNSVVVIAPQAGDSFTACFSLVPTSFGGRYRTAPDTANDASTCTYTSPSATCSQPMMSGLKATDIPAFDVLTMSPTPSATSPSVNDFVVIGNQNGNDVYVGSDRSAIATLGTPRTTDGMLRVTMAAGTSPLPIGYDQGRFVIVAQGEQVVYYSCSGNQLLRNVATFAAFKANSRAGCGAGVPVASVQAKVAGDGVSCTVTYDPGATVTEQNGLVWMNVSLTESGEAVALSHSTNVPNVP